MKKIFAIMLMVLGFICSANAQMITSRTGSIAQIDTNGDGLWDCEVNVGRIPCNDFITPGQTLSNALGKCYAANIWRQYESQGINPANSGLANPWRSDTNFSQYATAYSHLISYSGGMGVIGGMGLPGTASVGVNIGGVNVGLNIPVTNANNGLGGILTPNASVGVNVNGNGGYVSLPVGVKIGKKSSRKATTTVPVQQTTRVITVPAQQQTRVATPTQDSVEMTVDEIQNMMSGSYM
jgi:hypothetical protein